MSSYTVREIRLFRSPLPEHKFAGFCPFYPHNLSTQPCLFIYLIKKRNVDSEGLSAKPMRFHSKFDNYKVIAHPG